MKKSPDSLQLLRSYIRKQLSLKKMTYKALAHELGTSEITIKRWLTSRDFSIFTLIQIGKVLGFELFEIIQGDHTQPIQYELYSKAQEKFLVENPIAGLVLLKLIYNTGAAILQRDLGLSKARFFKILRQLDDAKFLEIQTGDKIRFTLKGPFLSHSHGAYSRRYIPRMRTYIFRYLNQKFAQETDLKDEVSTADFEIDRPFEMYMSRESATQFGKELMQVLAKYRNLTVHESKLGERMIPVSGYIGVANYDLWNDVYLGK